MHFLQATTFFLAALSMQSVSASPTRNSYPVSSECPIARNACKPGESGVLRIPEMRAILNGQRSEKIGHNIILSKSGDKKQDQEMTFHVPKGAKTCNLKWDQGEKRKFIVQDSGLAKIYPVEPAGAESVGAADFTNWPQVKGAQSHRVTSMDCKEVLTLRSSLEHDGVVKMKQDATNGWYLEYSC
ncbi:hypothetical protein RJZ56_007076 [Blastomyces dermatitidis]|uniref:Uncharacterized protein n=3 Tax=Blastomyces TaxID=229219 RepID=A0A179V0K1_BLAGS|nr:uncharacterized protein BDBG_17625 [Blastomyces gilchristii SLH14081]XP_045276570.1 uncharacterized protein BDCG_04827 [Blastomyces dermatitidis ER-3]EGE80651.1 hypothetical protein BDDG_03592 [Blastomyces dermatitidis ATCC 18188]EQL34677.1 hypothetical protein BDFG_03395 [Blastomyces dermatitidis ATCC 26199]EEQ89706.1 hypothetical protein BDCG_04827 [Blastomyces dermatitidis ER-3]OAT12122.1 hypothetical protein BDBG_17625 [Blastomyces gilchristii SLH14081]